MRIHYGGLYTICGRQPTTVDMSLTEPRVTCRTCWRLMKRLAAGLYVRETRLQPLKTKEFR